MSVIFTRDVKFDSFLTCYCYLKLQRRGKRSAEPLPNISDEEAAVFITSLLDEYRTTMGENYA